MESNQMFQQFNLLAEGARLRDTKFNEREVEDFINKAQLEITKERYAAWKNRGQVGYGANEVRNSELSGVVSGTAAIPRTALLLGNLNNAGLRGPDLDNADQDADKFGVFAPLPNEALYILAETVNTIKDTIVKENVPVVEKTYTEYMMEIRSDYKKPYENLAWAINWGSYTPAVYNSGSFDNSVKEFSTEGTGFNMQGVDYQGNPVEINTRRSRYLIPGKGWKIIEYMIHYIKIPRDINIDLITPSLQINSEMPDFMHLEIVDKAVKLAAAAIIPIEQKYNVAEKESREDE